MYLGSTSYAFLGRRCIESVNITDGRIYTPSPGITESYLRLCNVRYLWQRGLLILSIFIRPSRCRTSIKMPSAEACNNFARYYKDSTYVIENYTSPFAIAVHGRERRGRRETAYVCAPSRRRSIVQRADKYDSCAQPPRLIHVALWIHVFFIYSKSA